MSSPSSSPSFVPTPAPNPSTSFGVGLSGVPTDTDENQVATDFATTFTAVLNTDEATTRRTQRALGPMTTAGADSGFEVSATAKVIACKANPSSPPVATPTPTRGPTSGPTTKTPTQVSGGPTPSWVPTTPPPSSGFPSSAVLTNYKYNADTKCLAVVVTIAAKDGYDDTALDQVEALAEDATEAVDDGSFFTELSEVSEDPAYDDVSLEVLPETESPSQSPTLMEIITASPTMKPRKNCKDKKGKFNVYNNKGIAKRANCRKAKKKKWCNRLDKNGKPLWEVYCPNKCKQKIPVELLDDFWCKIKQKTKKTN